ncbi:MAG: hypothetical protein J6V54_09345, partial [Bacteroidales bacterium]|nr:hypothetical protein [Bacteroidales bacterium]
ERANLVIYMIDAAELDTPAPKTEMEQLKQHVDTTGKHFLVLANKADLLANNINTASDDNILFVSAKEKNNITAVAQRLVSMVKNGRQIDNTLLTNARHYEAFTHILEAIGAIKSAINASVPSDLIMIDIRQALYYLGLITGQVSSDEMLGNIFGRFCIGK